MIFYSYFAQFYFKHINLFFQWPTGYARVVIINKVIMHRRRLALKVCPAAIFLLPNHPVFLLFLFFVLYFYFLVLSFFSCTAAVQNFIIKMQNWKWQQRARDRGAGKGFGWHKGYILYRVSCGAHVSDAWQGKRNEERGKWRQHKEALQAALILRSKKEHTKHPSFVDSI